MSFGCTAEDIGGTDDEGALGLIAVLVDVYGWRVHERRRADPPPGLSRVVLTAAGEGIQVSVGGSNERDAARKLFGQLVSDEPDAVAVAAGFWPPAEPPATLPVAP